ncbi:MAG TPA: RteC domain-containing protein [Sphingobacteriaceae bacterium]
MVDLNKQTYTLERYSHRLLTAVENSLNDCTLRHNSERDRVVWSVKACKKALGKLRKYIVLYGFRSKYEEAIFFRTIKPLFYSQYIYFSQIHNFLLNRPPGGIKETEDYIQTELADLKRFFELNRGFYQYYRSGSSDLDDLYFTRQELAYAGPIDDHAVDDLFSTPGDYILSKLLANEKYQDYLNIQLFYISQGTHDGPIREPHVNLRWTSNKTDLVELIYALVETGALNNGTGDIKHVMAAFQKIFQVDLRSYYQKFGSIIDRKKDQTAFLDKLRTSLLRRIKEKLEEEPPQLKRVEFKIPAVNKFVQKRLSDNKNAGNRPDLPGNSRSRQRR